MSRIKNGMWDEIQESIYSDSGGVFEPINTNTKGKKESEQEAYFKAAREYIKTAEFAKDWTNAFYGAKK